MKPYKKKCTIKCLLNIYSKTYQVTRMFLKMIIYNNYLKDKTTSNCTIFSNFFEEHASKHNLPGKLIHVL